jgi:hypothetical protein
VLVSKKIEANTEELSDFERSLKHIIEEAIEGGDMLLRLAQNHAWSEEDSEILSMLIDLVESKEGSMEAKVELVAWLKSIRQRIG